MRIFFLRTLYINNRKKNSKEIKGSDEVSHVAFVSANNDEEIGKLIASVYEDKVMGKILEEVCIELLRKFQDEKTELVTEIAVLESKLSEMERTTADVDEFIRRLKNYLNVPELTREMCMELIEFVTVDECPGKYSKEPREIHIYYKLIDKQPPPEKKYINKQSCEDC